jgi:ribosomal protein S18 acetylase RimI-like enzyme
MESERLSSTSEPADDSAEGPRSPESSSAGSDFYPTLSLPSSAPREPGQVAASSEWPSEASGTILRTDLTAARPTLRDGVRRAGVEDATALAGIQVLSREYAYEQGLVPAPSSYDFDQLVDVWCGRLVRGPSARTFLGLSAGEPAGFIAAGPSRARISWEAEVYTLHVHPRFWRSRVIYNLGAAALDFLTQRGFRAVRMWVTETNTTVIDTLLARGFSVVEQRPHALHRQLELAFVQRLQ